MKKIILLTSLLISFNGFSQVSFDEWKKESKTNKRLLPRYGHLPKTEQEIRSDSAYVKQILELPDFKTRREASNHMIRLGFQYYYRPDLKTAMYRFNQAYLLDSTNTDIFWGYGAIYMSLGQFELAKQQYETGLATDPANTHLLTDLATYYLQLYYLTMQMPKNDLVKDPEAEAGKYMDSTLLYLNRSYVLDPKDVNTVYKLSIGYWTMKDCSKAWRFYDEAVALGGDPITEEYTNDLKKRCKRN
jgi:tetratricopeptide (TPR) repeat protein